MMNGRARHGDRPANDVEYQLPYVARVQLLRWFVMAIICLVVGIFLIGFFIGLVTGAVEATGRRSRTLWPLMPVLGVFVFAVGAYLLAGALRPQHVTIDRHGVHTRLWRLSWSEITGIRQLPKQLFLTVTPAAAQRVRPKNRWYSGRPMGLGGLLASEDTVGLQPSLVRQGEVREIIEIEWRGHPRPASR